MKKKRFLRAVRLPVLLLAAVCLFASFACCGEAGDAILEKQSVTFTDVFDTVTEFTVCSVSERTFRKASEAVHAELLRLHSLFDIYTAPDGENEYATLYEINERTYDPSRELNPDLFSILEKAESFWNLSGQKLNCAMGTVLTLWHDCMEGKTGVPSAEDLSSAAEHIGFDSVLLQNGKLSLTDKSVRFDLGAAAKGYAAEYASAVAKENGCSNFALNLGGNVLLSGKKPSGDWVIGIQDPDGDGIFTKVYVTDCSVVTSGNYQRCRDIDGVRYHHIIDPETCMPAGRYDSVTVICHDSLNADMLSTALFCMPEDDGERLAKTCGAEILWIYPDGSAKRTEGFSDYEG